MEKLVNSEVYAEVEQHTLFVTNRSNMVTYYISEHDGNYVIMRTTNKEDNGFHVSRDDRHWRSLYVIISILRNVEDRRRVKANVALKLWDLCNEILFKTS